MATKKFVPFSKFDQKFEAGRKDKEGKGKEGGKKDMAADKKQAKGNPFAKGAVKKKAC